MSNVPPDIAARIAEIRTQMGMPAAPGGAAPAPAAAAPAGDAGSGDMADKIAAIKAKMAGGAAPAASAAPAPAATGGAPAASDEDMQARIAALKSKMEAGKTSGGPAAAAKPKAAAKPAARSSKAIFPVQPIDRTSFGSDRLYGPTTLHKWFALASVLLLITSGLMWVRDWDRDWKHVQRRQRELDIERLALDVQKADEAIDAAELEAATAALSRAQDSLATEQAQLDKLNADRLALEGKAFRTNQDFQFAKSEFDAFRYNFEEHRLLHGHDDAKLAASEEKLETLRTTMEDRLAAADAERLALDAKKQEIATLSAEMDDATKSLGALTEERDLTAARLAKIDRGIFNDYIRNAPLVDMLQPTLKIDQIVLDKLSDNYNFMFVGKIDRCTTCHVNIDNEYFTDWDSRGENGERVFNSHPRLDLFVSDGSPHPKGEFGCTVCHQGRGQAVEFPRTFHTPSADPWEGGETAAEKSARWTEEFGYDSHKHYWDWPMVPLDKTYSSCFQCHQDTARLPGVPEYNESRALVEDLGCMGCHKIKGFEDYRKVGPDLTNLSTKTDMDWLRRWVMAPKTFRPSTKMPHFWDQSNRGADVEELEAIGYGPTPPWDNNSDRYVSDYRARNAVEARAISTYVMSQSVQAVAADDFQLGPVPSNAGNPDAGRELFESRGCLGCHSMESEGWDLSWHGPELSGIGSKTTAQWLFNWIQDPKKYYPTTVMPDLRLSSEEAWDITAFLMDHKAEGWDDVPQPAANDGVLDGIAVEFLSQLTSVAAAEADVAQMRAAGGATSVELYVGEKLFGHFGCSGCHLVPGHYTDSGIGTELTLEGLKEVAKFDFGFETAHTNPDAIKATRQDFFRAKLSDPRVFDRMPIVKHGEIEAYDQKVKRPADKLKMPNFYLGEHDIELLVQFLLGLREEGIDATMKHTLTGEAAVVEQASRIMTASNCVGCHRVGQVAQRVEYSEDVIEDGFEYGLWMARPLEVADKEVLPYNAWFTDLMFDPWEEEDVDTVDFFADAGIEDTELFLYGHGEGQMGEYLEDMALRPPVLRGEGEKVSPDWLYKFLLKPFTVRNHIEVRMPTFGFTPDEARALAQWFSVRDDQNWPFPADDSELDVDLLAEGAQIFETYQCNQCHPAGDQLPSNPDKLNWGPDLSIASERLKGEWIHDWLVDPQVVQPGTKMPNFFGEYAEGEYEVYVEDYEEQSQALRHFLKFMSEWHPPQDVSQN